MTYTSNYKLSQWSKSDRILMSDFNADNQRIDAALAAKASASTVTALASRVSSLETALPSKADADDAARIVTGSYTGNGGTTRTIDAAALGRAPKLVLARMVSSDNNTLIAIAGAERTVLNPANGSDACALTWSGTALTLTGSSAPRAMNSEGQRYVWAAIG